MTQIYYGSKWITDFGVHSETAFINIPSLLQQEFFVIAKNMKEIKFGHFTGEIKNGSKTLIEIDLSHSSLNMQPIKSLFKIIRQIQYCEGFNTVAK